MIIIGIDPGTATVGYGAIHNSPKKEITCLDFGCIKTSPKDTPEERLRIINNKVGKLIKKYNPDILAVEKLYFFKNFKTAMPVSQAKGVIMLAAAKKRVPVYEITPLEVKMTITGYGKATKKQIQEMVKKILNIEEELKPDDVSDALGVAICGALKENSNLKG